MSVSFCLPHPVAVSAFMICRGLCACTEMLWMCVLPTPHIHYPHYHHSNGDTHPTLPLPPCATLIPSTSAALDIIHEPYVITTPTVRHTSIFVTFAPSYSHATVHAPQSPHPYRVPIPPHNKWTKDDHRCTYPSVKVREIMILQVNINRIKTNWRSSKCLFTTHMHISSQLGNQAQP